MKNLAYYNGNIAPIDELMIPFNDRAHFFGDGIYEVTVTRNRKLYALDDHLDRLWNSASLLDIHIPYTREELTEILNDAVSRVDSPDQFVYWQISRGTQMRDHIYPEGMQGNLWIMIKPYKLPDIYKKITCTIADDTRFFHCNIKTLNLLPSVLTAQKAEREGFTECILHRNGRVTECSHSNVSIINQNGVFQTAPADNLILAGVARKHLIEGCHALGVEVSETPFTLDDLYTAKEIIVSASSKFGMGVSEIDHRAVGGGAPEQLKALQDYVWNRFLRATE